jgi:hypothetical protein
MDAGLFLAESFGDTRRQEISRTNNLLDAK